MLKIIYLYTICIYYVQFPNYRYLNYYNILFSRSTQFQINYWIMEPFDKANYYKT